MKTISKIKKARLKKGYTQADMAKMLGISLPTFILWEKEITSKPNPEKFEHMKEILNMKEEK